jgi:hypothetical protein
MGLVDVRIEASEDEYAFLRWQAVKLNTSIPGYIKRLISEERKRKAAEQNNVDHL